MKCVLFIVSLLFSGLLFVVDAFKKVHCDEALDFLDEAMKAR